jgi:apolipoprotein D and lipocalin family protein
MKTLRGLLTAACGLLAACSTPSKPPLKTVKHVDIARYMGDWRVIANIPYFAEKDCVDTVESYGLRKDGRIDNWFTYRRPSWDTPKKKFTALAWVHNKETNAEWRVRFVGLVVVPYLILDVDPQYRWAVVGHPSRNYGWVMARERTMPERTYREILGRLAEQGYDTSRFVKVPQVPPKE